MPKRSDPIVPAPAHLPKKKKVKRVDPDDEMPPPELVAAVPTQPSPDASASASPKPKKKKLPAPPAPPEEGVAEDGGGADASLQTVADGRTFIGQTGLEIAAQPDRSDKALRFLTWLVGPVRSDAFLAENYGRQPLHVARADRTYYDGWFSRAEIERQLRECSLRWTDEVDAARYVDGVRTTHNGEGVAHAEDVWARYAEGCSVRLSWPQRHSDPLWQMLSSLEELFGCMAGANAYLTPKGSQGFAPHWDDIDALVLQLEGAKTWKVYAPRSTDEALPRFSSPNLEQDELGPLLGEVTLQPGDLLYLPRGYVHQAKAAQVDSLHVTASLARQHTWRDLLEFGVFGAMESLTVEQPSWRETLPVDLWDRMGILHQPTEEEEAAAEAQAAAQAQADGEGSTAAAAGLDAESLERARVAFGIPAASTSAAEHISRRAAIEQRLRTMLHDLVDSLPLDAMCDQFACQRYLHERLPPPPAAADAARQPADAEEVQLDSKIRLSSRHVARLAIEDGVAALYYCSDNTRVYRERDEPEKIDFAIEAAPALEHVLTCYPKFVSVRKLPGDSDAQRLDVARALAEAKCVLVKGKDQ